MVDIGGDVGAAIVWTSLELQGTEIEIRRLPAAWDGSHTAVRERQTGSGLRPAALFGSLPSGDYELRRRPPEPGGVVVAVVVEGARVVEVSWPGP